jgi:hypothetical protein
LEPEASDLKRYESVDFLEQAFYPTRKVEKQKLRMEAPLSDQLKPYVNERLLRAAQRGLEKVSTDLVIYVDSDNKTDLLVTDRNKFLSIMSSCGEDIRHALDIPAKVLAARRTRLSKDAIVFWLVVAEPNGVRAQVLTLNNHYQLTTNFVGLA